VSKVPGIQAARQTGAGYEIQTEFVAGNAQWVAPAGAGPWPQITSVRPRLHVVHDNRHVAARAVEMAGSTTCSVNAGGDAGIERVAALLQRGHADRGRDPVGRGG